MTRMPARRRAMARWHRCRGVLLPGLNTRSGHLNASRLDPPLNERKPMGESKMPLLAVIHLRIERLEPLTGSAVTEEGAALAFEGWMELINAISELLGSSGRPPTNDRQPPSGG
jgi:hypothetical protein